MPMGQRLDCHLTDLASINWSILSVPFMLKVNKYGKLKIVSVEGKNYRYVAGTPFL
jgi:hypothetical protein